MDDMATYVTKHDFIRLQQLIALARRNGGIDADCLDLLEEKLEQGLLVNSQEVPGDVITMNSRARIADPATGRMFTFTLVFPEDADVTLEMVSVLAPVGMAMLGGRIGQEISWQNPAGQSRLQVSDILYQPEAVGHYHL